VLSWADGSVRAQFGSDGSGPGQLLWPRGIRLLADGSGVVVVDHSNHRLCVFALSGEFVAAVGNRQQGLDYPRDVLERVSDSSFIVINLYYHRLVKLSQAGVKTGVFGKKGDGNGEFNFLSALATLPNDGCLVVDYNNQRVQHLAHLHAKLTWMRACVSCTT
jgi:hypothetical protein